MTRRTEAEAHLHMELRDKGGDKVKDPGVPPAIAHMAKSKGLEMMVSILRMRVITGEINSRNSLRRGCLGRGP